MTSTADQTKALTETVDTHLALLKEPDANKRRR